MFLNLILGLALSASAQPQGDKVSEPENFCYFGCSVPQKQIWDEFLAARFAPDQISEPTVYSGECYHLAYQLRGEQAHHGVFFIVPYAGGLHAAGNFTFYAGENPYAAWSAKDAEANLGSYREPQKRLIAMETSGLLDLSSAKTPWRYWFRHNGNQLMVIGQWDKTHLLFCKLNPHARGQ